MSRCGRRHPRDMNWSTSDKQDCCQEIHLCQFSEKKMRVREQHVSFSSKRVRMCSQFLTFLEGRQKYIKRKQHTLGRMPQSLHSAILDNKHEKQRNKKKKKHSREILCRKRFHELFHLQQNGGVFWILLVLMRLQ